MCKWPFVLWVLHKNTLSKFNETFKRTEHCLMTDKHEKTSEAELPWKCFPLILQNKTVDMKWTNESSSIQTEKEKHHSGAFRITGIPERLRYSADSSNTFMHKQRQVSGAALTPASVRLGSLRTSGLALWRVWAATGNAPGTSLSLKQMLAFMNRGISSVLDFASHFLVSQPCQEGLGTGVEKLSCYETHANMKCVHLNCRWRALRETGWNMNHIFCIHLWSLRGFGVFERSTAGHRNCFLWNPIVPVSSVCSTIIIERAGFTWHLIVTCMRSLSGTQAWKLLTISQMCFAHPCVCVCV